MPLQDDLVLLAARKLTYAKLSANSSQEDESPNWEQEHLDNSASEPPTGRWELTELEEWIENEFGVEVDLHAHRDPLRSLIASGRIVRFQGGRYTEYTTPVAPMAQLTLLDLARKAADQVDSEHDARKGSRSADERRVEVLTDSQYQHIKTACNCLGRHIAGERRDRGDDLHPALAEVGSEYLVWNPDAGKRGKGDWKKLLNLVEKSAPASSVSQYVGSVRNLMDLAATHGWVCRTPVHDRHYTAVPANWAPIYNRWREELRGQIGQLKTGLMALFEACHRHRQETPEGADWDEIIVRLEERFQANDIPSHERTVIRRTYRAARDAELLAGPEWDGRKFLNRNAISLVPAGDRRAIAVLFGQDGSQQAVRAALNDTCVQWPGKWSQYSGLVEGRYGMRKWLLYATAPSSKAEVLDVPDRGIYPRDRIRGTSSRSDRGWSIATVEVRLEHLCQFAGWVAKNHDVDWSEADLTTLFRENHLRGYKAYMEEERDVALKTMMKYFGSLARIASPYLEWVAWNSGEEELADRMAFLSKLISSPDSVVDGGKSWIARWKSQDTGDRVERLRRVAKRVERTWTRSGKVAPYAYIQLRRVLASQQELLREDYGPLSEQVAAIGSGFERVDGVDGTYAKFDRKWARRVRDLIYWADQVVVPLRVGTSVRLDRVDRREDPSFTHLRAAIHRDKRKTSSPEIFRPNYYRENGGYPVDLYRLYVMPGGARERLLTLSNGRIVDADAHYVHDLKGGAKTARKSPDTFRSLTRRVVRTLLERRPEALSPGLTKPITYEELMRPDHVLATHMFRHAYARYWVREQEDLHTASSYLDHSDHSMLLDVYLGEDESDLDPAGKMADLPGG